MLEIVGVIAGTPVDTEMGEKYFEARGLKTVGMAAAPDSRAALDFFAADEDYKYSAMMAAARELVGKGAGALCIYCNALSAAVDFHRISEEVNARIITPFDAYALICKDYSVVASFAATTSALVKVEESILNAWPDADVRGQHLQSLTDDIEKGDTPATLIERYGLRSYVDFCTAGGCECIILACTHFPYLKEELQKISAIPIIDPADVMYELMIAN